MHKFIFLIECLINFAESRVYVGKYSPMIHMSPAVISLHHNSVTGKSVKTECLGVCMFIDEKPEGSPSKLSPPNPRVIQLDWKMLLATSHAKNRIHGFHLGKGSVSEHTTQLWARTTLT